MLGCSRFGLLFLQESMQVASVVGRSQSKHAVFYCLRGKQWITITRSQPVVYILELYARFCKSEWFFFCFLETLPTRTVVPGHSAAHVHAHAAAHVVLNFFTVTAYSLTVNFDINMFVFWLVLGSGCLRYTVLSLDQLGFVFFVQLGDFKTADGRTNQRYRTSKWTHTVPKQPKDTAQRKDRLILNSSGRAAP